MLLKPSVRVFLTGIVIVYSLPCFAQVDTLQQNKLDSLLSTRKGLFGKLAKELLVNPQDPKELLRADIPFQKFAGRTIRHILIQPLEFGVSISDTSMSLKTRLTRISNHLHKNTRLTIIRNNLFFQAGDKLSPFLLANNERYLRDLSFLNEARIVVVPVQSNSTEVDVVVFTKDVLSLGGGGRINNTKSVSLEVQDENLGGGGDRLRFQALFDADRKMNFGYGGSYLNRNMGGSFIDVSVGYLNFQRSVTTNNREEQLAYVRLVRPLASPYMKFTYGISAEQHRTSNLFNNDSMYFNYLNYRYRLADGWAGWNLSDRNIGSLNEFQRLRYLISTRIIHQQFSQIPAYYKENYSSAFADLFAVLGSISVFQLNFYKTGYIYGFGRHEDIPQGLEASITSGWTRKAGRERRYGALQFQRYHLTKKEAYFNYTLAGSMYYFNKKLEDITLFANLDYFSSLRQLHRWKQRFFLNASAARKLQHTLDELLVLESRYGIQHYKYDSRGGTMRITAKAESVFFSPLQVAFFKTAPFVFGSATLFKSSLIDSSRVKLYPAFGAGLRTRNESLIFGTMEFKGVWFPRKDLYNNEYVLKMSTNLRFKYTQNFIRRPEFIQVN